MSRPSRVALVASIAVGVVSIAGRGARADDTADPDCTFGLGVYATPSIWIGAVRWRFQAPSDVGSPFETHGTTSQAVGRAAIGVELRTCGARADAGVHVRLGGTVELVSGSSAHPDYHDGTEQFAALGLEVQTDVAVGGGWRLGPRLGYGRYDRGRQIDATAGIRVRRGDLSLGLDYLHTETRGDYVGSIRADGVLIGVGLEGRPGAWSTGIGAGVAALVLGFFVIAIAGGG